MLSFELDIHTNVSLAHCGWNEHGDGEFSGHYNMIPLILCLLIIRVFIRYVLSCTLQRKMSISCSLQNDPQHLSGLVRRILYQFIGPN